MNIKKLLTAAAFGLILLTAFTPRTARGADLTIYAYDSFVSEWGPAGKVIPKFEKSITLRYR